MPKIGFAQWRLGPVFAGLGVLLAAWFSAVASHGAEVRLVMPKDRSVVSGGKLLVFGSSGPAEKLPILIENQAGSQVGTVRSDARGWFKFQVGLEAGRNRVRVGATQHEIFLAAPGLEHPPEFLPLFVHTGQAQPCETCHQADGAFAGGGYPDVCLRCHVIEAANPEYRGPLTKERHFQVSGSQCGRCHDPHGERDMSLLRAAPAALCAQCHGERPDSGSLHGAFAKGSCMACHDAHVSGFPRLLTQALPGLCVDCHAAVTRGPGDHPDALSECVACHDPHGKAGSGLVRKGLDGRCVACHDGVGKGKTVHAALDEGCAACHQPHREDDLARAAVTCDDCHTLAGDGGVWARHGGLEIAVSQCIRCHSPHAAAGAALVRPGLHDPVASRECDACHADTAAAALGKAGRDAPCDDCHSILEELVTQNATLHDPVAEDGCTVCHDPHLSGKPGLLRAPQAVVCAECHDVLEGPADSMRHAAAETCTDCHAPHGSRHAQFLKTRPPALCLECHDDPAASGQELHPALDEGCSACHDPHSGAPPAVLTGPERGLCLECHDDPAAGAAQVHSAVQAGCSGCHEPHLQTREHLLRAAPGELCERCHPVAEAAQGKVVHEPVSDCTECHEAVAHGGDNVAFLATPMPELCLNCHDDPVAGQGKVHAALDEGCTACHDPHQGVMPGLLAGATPAAACLNCHDDPSAGKAAVHPPVQEACSLCHAPHASDNTALLVRAGRDLCLGCHDDPAAGQTVVHAPVGDSCSLCHAPHASDTPSYLLRSGNALCVGCHDPQSHKHKLGAAAGNQRFPASARFPAENGLYACLGCHLAHAGAERNLVKNRSELCVACHKI